MQYRGNRRGMSLAGTLVAGAVGVFMMMGLMSFMENLNKGTKAIDFKNQSQDFGNTLRFSVAKPENCKAVLNMGTSPIRIPTASLPTSSGTYTSPVSSIFLSNKKYEIGTIESGLKISELSLVFPVAQPSGDYVASLYVKQEPVAKGVSFGAAFFVTSIPLQISVAKDGTDTVLQSCYMGSTVDGQATCSTLGGRWLEGAYMPMNRCSMSADLVLTQTEWPDGIPSEGETSNKGERVEACYWQPQGAITVLTYECPGLQGLYTGGYRCHYDTKAHAWGMWAYDGYNKPVYRVTDCDKGVKVSTKAPSSVSLQWNDELYKAWGETSYDFLKEQDRLVTAKRCKYMANADTWLDCNNSRSPEDALQGKNGSCIFVRGVDERGFAGLILAHDNQCLSTDANCKIGDGSNYTGWIWVTAPRFKSLQATASGYVRPLLKEALGYPCYQVDVDKAVFTDPALNAPITSAPNDTIGKTPSTVKQCVMELEPYEKFFPPSMAGTPTTRPTIFTCDNTSLTQDNVRASFGANKCWYIKSGYVSPLTAPNSFNGIRIDSHAMGTAPTYPYPNINHYFDEGWVNMITYQLPPDYSAATLPLPTLIHWWVPGAATSDYRLWYDSTIANHGYGYILANPCTIGVRTK